MPRKPTARERRTIAIGLCIAIPALIFAVSRPYRVALTEAREQLAMERAFLADELALLADLERYPGAYRTADSALARVAPRLFDETDDVLATSRLTSYVAGHALSSRVLVQEAESRPTQRTKDGIRTLQVEIRAESDTEGMLRFLQALERGPKMVNVEEVAITRSERVVDKGASPTTVLTLTATISGYAFPDTASARGAAMTAFRPEPNQ